MTWEEIQQAAVDNIACPYCGANAAYVCKTSRLVRARQPHTQRVQPIQQAWSGGYLDGERDMLSMAADSPEWFARRVERHRQERAEATS